MFRSTAFRKGPGLAIVLALVALLAPAGAQARPEAKTSQNGCVNTNLKPTRANLELVRLMLDADLREAGLDPAGYLVAAAS